MNDSTSLARGRQAEAILNAEMEHEAAYDTTTTEAHPMGSRNAEMAHDLGKSLSAEETESTVKNTS